MAMTSCCGLVHSEITGEPICPREGEPPEDMTWDDYCSECEALREHWLELAGDCDRDER